MNDTPEIQRQPFFDALNRYLGEESEGGAMLGVVLIDVRNLKKINHAHGFDSGNAVLSAIFTRLLSISKLPRTVFRVSGHHFIFILPGLLNPAFVALAMNKIQRSLSEDIRDEGLIFNLDVELGYALNQGHSLSAYELLMHAERSLSMAKSGIPHNQHYEEKDPPPQSDDELEQHFKETLQSNGFELYYQPKLNFATGKIDQVEALLRWKNTDQKFISPEVAVALADKTGNDFALTKWVVHTAVRQLKRWQQSINVGISLNVQANLISNPELVSLVNDALAIWGSERSLLTLEITESAIIEDKSSGLDNLLQLQQSGVALSIDDFGTGYSSLSYFKDIPATELKIDKSFVMNMLTDQQDRDIVKIIIEIAHLFKLKVVAEGVEDEKTLRYIKSLGCDYAQGYFISRPLPVKEFESWIENYTYVD